MHLAIPRLHWARASGAPWNTLIAVDGSISL
jgi:hypothetical protein